MRSLTVGVLFVLLAASPVLAGEKDEAQAKEVTLAFLAAVKAKDLDAVMETVDVPFMFLGEETISKPDELRVRLKTFVETVPGDKVPTEVGSAFDMPGLRRKFRGKGADKKLDELEAFLGKTGYAVMMIRDGKELDPIFVQVKDGKARVVVLPK